MNAKINKYKIILSSKTRSKIIKMTKMIKIIGGASVIFNEVKLKAANCCLIISWWWRSVKLEKSHQLRIITDS